MRSRPPRARIWAPRKERMVDPAYYPRLKGAEGIFRVSLPNVQNSLLIQRTLAQVRRKLRRWSALALIQQNGRNRRVCTEEERGARR